MYLKRFFLQFLNEMKIINTVVWMKWLTQKLHDKDSIIFSVLYIAW
jgi:hypothetical protein